MIFLFRTKRWLDAAPIEKNFYFEDATVASMEPSEVAAFRELNNNIAVHTVDQDDDREIPNPVSNFEQVFQHYPEILEQIELQG